MFSRHGLFSLLLLYGPATIADAPVAGHDLFITFDRATGAFTARDVVTSDGTPLPDLSIDPRWSVGALHFDGNPVEPGHHVAGGVIDVPDGTAAMTIEYAGRPGDDRWPYLVWLPDDGWYADAPGLRHTFRLEARLPGEFAALTQGTPAAGGAQGTRAWRQDHPQQGIYLLAGPWHAFGADRDGRRAAALLLEDEPDLAERYLEAALDWLGRYSEALGEYPYHAFTLVENRHQTGWGMPGFTLLGSRVIRLPFIVHTSFPHEIAHNWWGNGVFVDHARGNWSEPLTTYLADHLVREANGAGRRYRLDTLASWHDFAAGGGDFPLAEFTARHDEATQAVGYGKGMFVFHMLRRRLGDEVFLDGLRRFYRDFRYRHASFDDLRGRFEAACGCDLDAFFGQWLERTGAPRLSLVEARRVDDGGHALTLTIAQQPAAAPWRLRVPVRITHADGTATWREVALASARATFRLPLDAAAARVDLDPEIDLFRHLGDDERPVTFSRVFGADEVAVVFAGEAYAGAAQAVAAARPGWRAVPAGQPVTAPAVVWLGSVPAGEAQWSGVAAGRYRVGDGRVELDGESYAIDHDTRAALVDEVAVGGGTKALLWVGSPPAEAARIVERLSHYGRYSYAVFEGDANVAARTGRWRARAAALSRVFGEAPVEPAARLARPLF